MIGFWIAIALMLAAAVAAVLWPLLGAHKVNQIEQSQLNISIIREQFKQVELDYKNALISKDEYQTAQAELELAVIENTNRSDGNPNDSHFSIAQKTTPTAKTKGTAMVLLVALPTISLLLYNLFGSPSLIATPPRLPPTQADVESMVDGLAARLESNPDDLEGWAILGKSYMLMGRFADAKKVFAKLLKQNPDSVGLLISFADASAMHANGSFTGEPYNAIKKALQLDPENIKARWMAGMAENEIGNTEKTLSIWNPLLLELQQQNPDMAAELQRMIAALTNSNEIAAVASANKPNTNSESNSEESTDAASLRIKVTLAPNVKLTPSDTLFVYARAMQGPPMPLAIKRYSGTDIPDEIVLDDTTAMIPAMRLSLFPVVKIDARISKSGSATPQTGDIFGQVENVAITTSDIIPIVINQVVP